MATGVVRVIPVVLCDVAEPEAQVFLQQLVVTHVMCSVAGKVEPDQTVEYIDRRHAQINRLVAQAQELHGIQNPVNIRVRCQCAAGIRATRIYQADIRICQCFVIKNSITQRVVDCPDGHLTAREVDLALESPALGQQLFQNRKRAGQVAVHRTFDPSLLKKCLPDCRVALDLSPGVGFVIEFSGGRQVAAR